MSYENAKPIEVKLVGQKSKRNIVPVISLLLSATAFVFSIFPALNPLNRNYEQKALAGHVKSQMYLADYHYQIGEAEKSVFYYSLVVEQPKLRTNKQRDCFYLACSNLGYLYLTTIKSEDSRVIAARYFEKGMEVLTKDKRETVYKPLAKNYILLEVSTYRHRSDLYEWNFWDEEATRDFYNEDPLLSLLLKSFDYLFDFDKEEYSLLRRGYCYVDNVDLPVENEIEGCSSFQELDRMNWRNYALYIATGDEAPQVEEGDVLIRVDDAEYTVYRELTKANAFQYYSYINYVDPMI